MWENLEYTWLQRFGLRAMITVATYLLILIGNCLFWQCALKCPGPCSGAAAVQHVCAGPAAMLPLPPVVGQLAPPLCHLSTFHDSKAHMICNNNRHSQGLWGLSTLHNCNQSCS